MQFDNGLSLFHHLLELDEENLRQNLEAISSIPSKLYSEVIVLIDAHEKNKEGSSGFTHFIGSQASLLSNDDELNNLEQCQVGVYKLVKRIGAGGMGVVYLGERNDGKIQQQVALKFVYPSIGYIVGESFIQQEAQYLADLNHPNIAKIFSVETADNNLPYMVMEYISGVSVNDFIAEKGSVNSTLKLLAKLANALEQAHRRGIVHADVKPSNIMLDDTGEPKLLDFGVASSMGEGNSVRISAVSTNFASPTVCDGHTPTPLDDIYSLGKVMEYTLAPYALSDEYQAVISKALSDDPLLRFQSMREFQDALESLMQNKPLYWYKNSFVYLYKKWLERSPVSAIAITLVPFILVASTVLVSLQNTKLQNEVNKNQELVDFYNELFLTPSPMSHSGNVVSAADFIGTGVAAALSQSVTDEETRASVLTTLARSLIKLGFLSRASQISEQLGEEGSQGFLLKSIIAFEQQLFEESKALLTKHHELHAPTIDSEILAVKLSLAMGNHSLVEEQFVFLKDTYGDLLDSHQQFELMRLSWENSLASSATRLLEQLEQVDTSTFDNYQQAWMLALRATAFAQLGNFEQASDNMLDAIRISETAFNPGNPVYAVLLEKLLNVAVQLGDGRVAAILLAKQQSLYEYLDPIFNTQLLENYERQVNLYANTKMWAQSLSFVQQAIALCNAQNAEICMRLRLKQSIIQYSMHRYEDAFELSQQLVQAPLTGEAQFYAYLVFLNSRIGIGESNSETMLNRLATNEFAQHHSTYIISTAIRSGQVSWAIEFGLNYKSSLTNVGLLSLSEALSTAGRQEEAKLIVNDVSSDFIDNLSEHNSSIDPQNIVLFDIQSELLFTLDGGNDIVSNRRVDGVISPSDDATLTIGEPYLIQWDAGVIKGKSLTLYINHTNHFSVAGVLSWENIKKTSWQIFGQNIENTGSLEIDPVIMMANGVGGFKVLLVSDQGYWDLSDGLFSINSGKSNDLGLRQQINPLLLVDSVIKPQAHEVYHVGERNQIIWDPLLLRGRHVRIYVLHDNPVNIGSGMNAQYETVLRKRWYLVTSQYDNSGVYELDPAQFNGRGNAYKILIYTEQGYWSVSDERFTVTNPY
tara:strand:- start:4918 stop:8202 length:3285 start_codon:yes stop_codon:yes gene_type:complete